MMRSQPSAAAIVAAALAVALAGCAARDAATLPQLAPASFAPAAGSVPTGILVPLYVAPGKVWSEAIAAKRAHPSVRMAIVANVNNGPGGRREAAYAKGIERAQKAGIYVLGYTYESYGKRSLAALESAILRWSQYYRTDGVFIDEMAPNARSYNRAATAYAHGHALWFVMGNPGTNAPGDAGPNVINYYESRGYPSIAFLSQPAHRRYGKRRWSFIAGAVPFDAAKITAAARYVAYLYATDGREPECYCKLPTYFDKLVALLSR